VKRFQVIGVFRTYFKETKLTQHETFYSNKNDNSATAEDNQTKPIELESHIL
jgi:hypothetical protein